ncbi:MAG TPA: carboxypeptidase-like regulatory domain-containing protein, partial [Terriglobia bacterium]|nr:carboxypeptidase-like regulatory domain-containing protein [Terriglobia bacterium]
MRRVLLAVFALGMGLSPLIAMQQVPTAPLPGGLTAPLAKGTVSGTVLRATTGEPLARVTVTLTRAPQGARGGGGQAAPGQRGQQGQQQGAQAQQQPLTFTATTDDQGKFAFTDVDDGAYRVFAARNGFARQEYGQRSPNRAGSVIDVRAGQPLPDISFRLVAASTISGRVMDSSGEPLPGVTVQALRSTYNATGQRTLQAAGSARTNDLGEYRIYWINPGRYFVSANPARSAFDLITASASQAAAQAQNPAQAQQAQQAAAIFGGGANPNEVVDPGYGPIYYPGSADASRAVGLDLQPAAEM